MASRMSELPLIHQHIQLYAICIENKPVYLDKDKLPDLDDDVLLLFSSTAFATRYQAQFATLAEGEIRPVTVFALLQAAKPGAPELFTLDHPGRAQ